MAGGQSKRLGRNKAIEPIGQEVLIERVINRLSQVTSETIVVVADDSKVADLPLPSWVRTASDLYPGSGSLGGIFTGLTFARGRLGVVTACDMPFINIALVRFMVDLISDYDAVVPIVDGRPEPLHAVYSKTCLDAIEQQLGKGLLKIAGFFDLVNVAFVGEEHIRALDPDLLSFFNINTQEDLDKALAMEAHSLQNQ